MPLPLYAFFLHECAVVVVELVPVAVALGDLRRAVAFRHLCAGHDAARIRAEAQRAALVDLIALVRHEVDDLVCAALVKLAGVGVCQPADGACKLDDCDLHAQTDAEVYFDIKSSDRHCHRFYNGGQ